MKGYSSRKEQRKVTECISDILLNYEKHADEETKNYIHIALNVLMNAEVEPESNSELKPVL